jgi:hypothetical protein
MMGRNTADGVPGIDDGSGTWDWLINRSATAPEPDQRFTYILAQKHPSFNPPSKMTSVVGADLVETSAFM